MAAIAAQGLNLVLLIAVYLWLSGNFSIVGASARNWWVRLDRRAGALGIVRHRRQSLKKFRPGLRPWTQGVKK
jgi:hypothetical protein